MDPVLAFYSGAGNAALAAIGLAMSVARPFGFVLTCPIFNRFGLQAGIVRGAILVSLAIPVVPTVLTQIATSGAPPDLASLPLMMGRELGIGALLGLVIGIPFWAASAAGDYIDMQRGASMANLVDPGAGGETSVTGTLLFLCCVMWLIVAGVFIPAIFGPLYASYSVVPVLSPIELPGAERGVEALRLLSQLARGALVLALPVLVPLLLTEIVIAIGTKYVQQLNGMFIAMSVKQAVYAVLMLVYALTMVGYAMGALGSESTLNGLRAFLAAP